MRKLLTAGVFAVALLTAATPASAKGPVEATITGPGIDPPIVITGTGEYANGSDFSSFVEATGFWQLVFGADFEGDGLELSDLAPGVDLGDRYVITWDLGEATVDSVAFPNAAGGALVYVEPHKWITGFGMYTEGGWFAATGTFTSEFGTAIGGYDAPMTATPPATQTKPSAPQPIESDALIGQPVAFEEMPPGITAGAAHVRKPSWVWLSVVALGVVAMGSTIWAYRRCPRRLRAS